MSIILDFCASPLQWRTGVYRDFISSHSDHRVDAAFVNEISVLCRVLRCFQTHASRAVGVRRDGEIRRLQPSANGINVVAADVYSPLL